MRALILQHTDLNPPGIWADALEHAGVDVHLARPDRDGAPADVAEYDLVVALGGPQSARPDAAPAWLDAEVEAIRQGILAGVAFLGVCLGAQMLAQYLGARVDHCQHGNVEIGYHPIRWVDGARALGEVPDHVYQWHREGFDIPRGGRLLAVSDGPFPNQVMSYGRTAVGIQFHPEITYAQVNRWSGSNPMRLYMKGARPRHEHLAGHLTHGPRVRSWLDQFLSRWTKAELALA
jgi:GMP synthase (glutamine-hydrolysing)